MNWRTTGDVPESVWRSTILRAGGPEELAEAWEEARPLSRLALAMLSQESSYGTQAKNNTLANKNPLNLRHPDSEEFIRFPTFALAIQTWRNRITSPTYKDGVYARTTTLRDLVEVYAPRRDGNDVDSYVVNASSVLFNLPLLEDPMSKPTIVLIAGHRSYNDSGNPEEKSLTDDLARAYQDAFAAAGFKSLWLQEDLDGDADPDDTVGGLDTVGRAVAAFIAKTPGELWVLDLHYEGGGAGGAFVIVPDESGLGTAIAGGAPGNDTWWNNAKEQRFGRAFTSRLNESTGLAIRRLGVKEPGLMSETQTGVAYQFRARLATMAYTAPWRDRCFRVVIEHGALDKAADRAVIFKPGFALRAAADAVEALRAVIGETAPGNTAVTLYPVPGPVKTQRINGADFVALGSGVKMTAKRDTFRRQFADPKAKKPTNSRIKKGATIEPVYVVIGSDSRPWYALADGARVPVSAFLD